MVPASLRTDDSDVSNRITMILANLGTHKDQPLERLEIIRRSMQNSKQRFSRMTANEILNYSVVVYGPAGLNIMSGMLPKRQAFNLVISNVPAHVSRFIEWGEIRCTLPCFYCHGRASAQYYNDKLSG